MRGIRRRSVVLEWSVMRNVVPLCAHNRRGRLAVAPGAAVRIYQVQVKTSREPTPGDTRCIKQVADILSPHLRLASAGAHVSERIRVADHRQSAVSVAYIRTRTARSLHDAVGLARNQIDRAYRGRPKVGAEGVST